MYIKNWNKLERREMYEAIGHRKSTRSFKPEALSAGQIKSLQEQTAKLQPLFPEEKIAFRILKSTQVKGRVSDKAYYVAGYAEKSLESYTNLGFMMEQLVLWLTAHKIATWWHGLITPIREYADADGLPFAFMFTLGIADGEALRDKDEFIRKDISQISDINGIDTLLEAVRFAPSGRNAQPWHLTGNKDELKMFIDKENALIRRIAPNVEYINAGIGLCHLWLAAGQEGKSVMFVREPDQKDCSKKMNYICTIKLTIVN